jgi:hypothetical protein
MPAMAKSYRGVNFVRRTVAPSAGAVPRNERDSLGCSVWVSNRQGGLGGRRGPRSAPRRTLTQTKATVLLSEAKGVGERAPPLEEGPARPHEKPSITRRDRRAQQGCNRLDAVEERAQ